MTISVTDVKTPDYAPNGVTVAFPVNFYSASDTEIEVVLDGEPVSPGEYEFTRDADGTGEVVFYFAPVGTALYIRSVPEFTQEANFERYGAFFPDQINPLLDRLAAKDIYLLDETERSIRVPVGSQAPPGTPEGIFDYIRDLLPEDTMPPSGVIRPYSFGAAGDGTTDDTIALQAFMDHAFTAANRRKYVYDWRGKWAISDTIYANYPYVADEPPIHMICGQLRVLPVADQPGGVPMDVAIYLGGTRNNFSGLLYVNGFNDNGSAARLVDPPQRRFIDGVVLYQTAQSNMPNIKVDGAIRNAVACGRQLITTRPGTPYEVTHPANNHIGTRFGQINVRYSGSCSWTGNFKHVQILSYTGNDHGGLIRPAPADPRSMATWDSTEATYAGAPSQACRLTMADTGYLRDGDMIKIPRYILPATFGTVAVDVATRTMTWSAGDPVAAGLVAGMRIQIRHDSGVGIDPTLNYQEFEIIGFSGTSNRIIHLAEAPYANLTALAVEKLRTNFSIHYVYRVNAGSIDIYPWLSSANTSGEVWCIYGAVLDADGADTSGVTVDEMVGNCVGFGIKAGGLFGANVNTMVTDYCEVSILHGSDVEAASNGGRVHYLHSEVTELDYAQLFLAPGSVDFTIDTHASYTAAARRKSINLAPRPTVSDEFPAIGSDTLYHVAINIGGDRLQTTVLSADPATSFTGEGREVSNLGGYRERRFRQDAMDINIGLDHDFARMGADYQWFRVMCIGSAGGAPSGAIVLKLNDDLQRRGWTLVGIGTKSAGALLGTANQVSTIAAGAKPFVLHGFFDRREKEVIVQQALFA